MTTGRINELSKYDQGFPIYPKIPAALLQRGDCGGYRPGYPRGGPIRPPGQGMGRANDSQEDTSGLLAAQDFQLDKDQHLGYLKQSLGSSRLGL